MRDNVTLFPGAELVPGELFEPHEAKSLLTNFSGEPTAIKDMADVSCKYIVQCVQDSTLSSRKNMRKKHNVLYVL